MDRKTRGLDMIAYQEPSEKIQIQVIGDCWEAWAALIAGPCPHCNTADNLIVTDVEVTGTEPHLWPRQVACGSCGARGPWGNTEELAVREWNRSSNTNAGQPEIDAIFQYPPEYGGGTDFPF